MKGLYRTISKIIDRVYKQHCLDLDRCCLSVKSVDCNSGGHLQQLLIIQASKYTVAVHLLRNQLLRRDLRNYDKAVPVIKCIFQQFKQAFKYTFTSSQNLRQYRLASSAEIACYIKIISTAYKKHLFIKI